MLGCATATSTVGTDFDGAKVSEIKKGVTTSSELVALFGPPTSKSVKSETDVEWVFSWATATAKASMGWTAPDVKTKGYKKTLSVLVRNDVVVNFAYDEGPFESHTHGGSK